VKKNITTWRRYIFFAVWILTTAIFGWQMLDLETAIGFHFWLDFVKFAAAYLLNTR